MSTLVDRDEILQDVHNIVRTPSLSRAAVETSTPEQIVWMTAKVIAENLQMYALEGFRAGHDAHRWYPRETVLATVIRREIENLKLPEKTMSRIIRAIDRALEEWPS